MKSDFALESILFCGCAGDLAHIAEQMRNHVACGDLSDEEFKQYVQFIGKSIGGNGHDVETSARGVPRHHSR